MWRRFGAVVMIVEIVSSLTREVFSVRTRKHTSSHGLTTRDIIGDYDARYDGYFPRHYHATGLLTLPFDDIIEPFEAWFAGDKNVSRIDYYYGMRLNMLHLHRYVSYSCHVFLGQ